jgi:hypothetical protein
MGSGDPRLLAVLLFVGIVLVGALFRLYALGDYVEASCRCCCPTAARP